MSKRWDTPSQEVITEALNLIERMQNPSELQKLRTEIEILKYNITFFESGYWKYKEEVLELKQQLREKEKGNDSTSNN